MIAFLASSTSYFLRDWLYTGLRNTLAVTLFVIPVFVHHVSLRPMQDKAFLLWILALFVITQILGVYFVDPYFPRPAGFFVVLTIFLLIIAVSLIFSIVPGESWWGAYEHLQGVSTWMALLTFSGAVYAVIKSWDDFQEFLCFIIIPAVPIAFYGLLQSYNLDPLPWASRFIARGMGFLGNPLFAASALLMYWFVLIGWAGDFFLRKSRQSRRWLDPLVQGLIFGLVGSGLYATQARAAWLAWGFIQVWWLLAVLSRVRIRFSRILRMGLWIVIIGVVTGLMMAARRSAFDMRVSSRATRFLRVFTPEQDTSIQQRFLLWKSAWDLLFHVSPLPVAPSLRADPWHSVRFWIGYGSETQAFVLPHTFPVQTRLLSLDRAHNLTYDLWLTNGLFGVLFFYGLWEVSRFRALQQARVVPTKQHVKKFWAFSLMGLVSVITVAKFWFPFYVVPVVLPFGKVFGEMLYFTFVDAADFSPFQRIDWWLLALTAAISVHIVEIQALFPVTTTSLLYWVLLGVLWRFFHNREILGIVRSLSSSFSTTSAILLGLIFGPTFALGFGVPILVADETSLWTLEEFFRYTWLTTPLPMHQLRISWPLPLLFWNIQLMWILYVLLYGSRLQNISGYYRLFYFTISALFSTGLFWLLFAKQWLQFVYLPWDAPPYILRQGETLFRFIEIYVVWLLACILFASWLGTRRSSRASFMPISVRLVWMGIFGLGLGLIYVVLGLWKADTYALMAAALEEMNPEGASVAYLRAITLFPWEDAYYAQAGRFWAQYPSTVSWAEFALLQAYRLNPQNYHHSFMLAIWYWQQGNLEKARVFSKQALALAPSFQGILQARLAPLLSSP